MMCGARTGAWSGGAKLPYDAEVEWFSTVPVYVGGTNPYRCNFFDIGINYGNDTGWEMEVTRLIDNTSDEVCFGSRNGGGETRYFVGAVVNGLWYFGYGSRVDFTKCVVGSKTILSFNFMNTRRIFVNGNEGPMLQSVFDGNNFPVLFPGYTNENSVVDCYVKGNYMCSRNLVYWRFGPIRITKGNNVVFDAVPVRVGDNLCLFEKNASKVIYPFFQQSSMPFIIGPDKTV